MYKLLPYENNTPIKESLSLKEGITLMRTTNKNKRICYLKPGN